MTMDFGVGLLDLRTGDERTPIDRPGWSTLTSLMELEDFSGEAQRAGKVACIISLTGAATDAESVRVRRELNATIQRSGSRLVPCVFANRETVYAGPWLIGRSTPCLECFSPLALPHTPTVYRVDELAGPDGLTLLSGESAQGKMPTAADSRGFDGLSFPDVVLEAVSALLHASLSRMAVKSVWGRIIRFHLTGSGRVAVKSWRALKDPYCSFCTVSPDTRPQSETAFTPRLSRIFHENTKVREYFRVGDAVDPSYAPSVPASAGLGAQRRRVHPLPNARAMRTMPIEEAILRRRSRRNFTSGEIDLQDLSALLFFAGGITKTASTKDGKILPLRAAPSGGGLYPIDIYISVRRVSGLPRGIYRYLPIEHALEAIEGPQDRYLISSADLALERPTIDGAAAVFFLAATFERNQVKYMERGYRVVLLEAGHIAQSLHLVATARKLRSCCVNAFIDDRAREVLCLAAESASEVVYLVAVGR
jgi:SagB-type dehydrogenase family enzyme